MLDGQRRAHRAGFGGVALGTGRVRGAGRGRPGPAGGRAGETTPYDPDAPPVFFGHYWLEDDDLRPDPLAANVACLDYSVAKRGYLCAYRWDGEAGIDPEKFVVASPTGVS